MGSDPSGGAGGGRGGNTAGQRSSRVSWSSASGSDVPNVVESPLAALRLSGELLLGIRNKCPLPRPEHRAICPESGGATVNAAPFAASCERVWGPWGDKREQHKGVLYLAFFCGVQQKRARCHVRGFVERWQRSIYDERRQELIHVFNKAAALLVPARPHFTPIFLTAAVREEAAARVGPRQVRQRRPEPLTCSVCTCSLA